MLPIDKERVIEAWAKLLIASGEEEIAAVIIDSNFEYTVMSPNSLDKSYVNVNINLPPFGFHLVNDNEGIKNQVLETFHIASRNHLLTHQDYPYCWRRSKRDKIQLGLNLKEYDENWKEVIRDLIAHPKPRNQGIVSEAAFRKRERSLISYNEMKFASKSEIRIAQILEDKSILFFPLPLAVKYEKGNIYHDHREPDFLICDDGRWGILEVAYHPGRYEKDAEKEHWWNRSGVLCVKHYTAERCYKEPQIVVQEFLEYLSRF